MLGGRFPLTLDTLGFFKQLGHHMDISKLQVFLLVAQRPHCTSRFIVDETGITQSTVSRITRALGTGVPTAKRPGLGLVVAYPDREDPRRMCYVLSAEGRKVFKQLQERAA